MFLAANSITWCIQHCRFLVMLYTTLVNSRPQINKFIRSSNFLHYRKPRRRSLFIGLQTFIMLDLCILYHYFTRTIVLKLKCILYMILIGHINDVAQSIFFLSHPSGIQYIERFEPQWYRVHYLFDIIIVFKRLKCTQPQTRTNTDVLKFNNIIILFLHFAFWINFDGGVKKKTH